MERNLIQTVRMMRLALPHMQGRTGAAVINVASISDWLPQLAMSGQYGAAKAALISTPSVGHWNLCRTASESTRCHPAPFSSRVVAGIATASPTKHILMTKWCIR